MTQSTTASVGIDLSNQELWYVLRQFPGQAIPGARLPDLQPEELLAQLEAGANALQARGLLEFNMDPQTGLPQAILSRVIGGLVGAGITAQHVLLMTYELTPMSGDTTWIYFTPDIIVAHASVSAGVHRFFVINSGDLFISALILALHLDTDRKETPPYAQIRIPISLLTKMREAPESAYEYLATAVEADEATLQAFARAVIDPTAYCQIVMAHTEDQPTNQFRLLDTEEGYWALEEDGNELICQPVVPLQITGLINDWVSQIKA